MPSFSLLCSFFPFRAFIFTVSLFLHYARWSFSRVLGTFVPRDWAWATLGFLLPGGPPPCFWSFFLAILLFLFSGRFWIDYYPRAMLRS